MEGNGELSMRLDRYFLALTLPYFVMALGILPQRNNLLVLSSILILFLFAGIAMVRYGRRYVSARHFAEFAAVALIMIAVVLVNTFQEISFSEFVLNINAVVAILYLFLVFVLFRESVLADTEILRLLQMIQWMGILLCVINLGMNYRSILNLSSAIGGYSVSFRSIFFNRNHFGSFLYLAVIAEMLYLRLRPNRWGWAALALFLVNLVLTFSRASLLAAAVFLLLYWMGENWRKKIWILLLAAALLAVVAFNSRLASLVSRFVIRSDAGSAGRFSNWTAVLRTLGEHPLYSLGISASGFKKILAEIGISEVDNAFLEVLFTYGFFVFILYVYILASAIGKAAGIIRRTADADLGRLFMAASISYLVYSLFESLVVFEAGLQQWMALMLIVVLPRSYANRSLAADKAMEA